MIAYTKCSASVYVQSAHARAKCDASVCIPATHACIPAGATGIPLHWALHTDKRAVCLRFAPEDRSDLSAPWSHSVQIGQAGKGDQHVAIPVRVPGKDQQGETDLPLSQLEP